MKALHTPGPWLLDEADMLQDPDTVFSIGVWAGEGDDKVMVANVTAFGLDSEVRDGVEYVTPTGAEQAEVSRAQANARLIAAAPDMLLALRSLMNLFEQHEDAARIKSPVGDYARAAIQKATTTGAEKGEEK